MENGTIGSRLTRAWHCFVLMLEISASRHQLAELDDAALHDLGISRAQARFEAARSPWDDTDVIEAPKRGTRLGTKAVI